MVEILEYDSKYENELMDLIRDEGEDWAVYWREPNASLYRKFFSRSITYIALSDKRVCGYSRSMRDVLYIYLCDLLVDKSFRGKGIGSRLMKCIQSDYPELPVYVMSGNDEYYQSLGCKREGSIFLLK